MARITWMELLMRKMYKIGSWFLYTSITSEYWRSGRANVRVIDLIPLCPTQRAFIDFKVEGIECAMLFPHVTFHRLVLLQWTSRYLAFPTFPIIAFFYRLVCRSHSLT